MSQTVILAACLLRLAQISIAEQPLNQATFRFSKLRWAATTASVSVAAIWATSSTLGPAKASSHWDKYLITSKANKYHNYDQLVSSDVVTQNASAPQMRTEAMIFQLRNTVARDPRSARANLKLAGNYLQLFRQRQQTADNNMSIDQIRDAAIASQFRSSKELRLWLQQAFGEDYRLLYQAHYHSKRALHFCPLHGAGYLQLAKLAFLENRSQDAIHAYIDQSLRVRPYQGSVVFEAGRQRMLLGEVEQAFKDWQQIYRDAGVHQLKIIQLLAGHLPANVFIGFFNPNWQTLRHVWKSYLAQGTAEDWQLLLAHAKRAALLEAPQKTPREAAYIWNDLAKMQTHMEKPEDALHSIEYAYKAMPNVFWVRHTLGQKLLQAEKYKQAEPHLRWCLARQPQNESLQKKLVRATKNRLPRSVSSAANNNQYR